MGLPSTIGGPSCSVPLVPEDLKFSSFFAWGIFVGFIFFFVYPWTREILQFVGSYCLQLHFSPDGTMVFILGEYSLLEIH
ncbi:unnamed protein product [Acanthoscelides obtectus]|uniref:Uncharacterized protein n=1 Tax=Acanthoscelides obtectus TaxID=200917 RepID=A0A9P0KYH9_ACAOB|nr:unnamed protein product [Acanthoscelides obtectus]CAK1654834.1 hypothetical protein AOBTE_LOCUS18882 [Acanthoscelides obtectus]